VDWWGVGILIHEMVAGQAPFNDISNARLMSQILHNQYLAPDWFSKKLQDLLVGLLDKNPETRLGSQSAGGTEGIKSHPFLADVDWDQVYEKSWMKAPLKPKTKNPWDTKNIDGVFLNEQIKPTPESESININLLQKMHFENFSYNEDSAAHKGKYKMT